MTNHDAPYRPVRLDEEALRWIMSISAEAIVVSRLADDRLLDANQAYADLTGIAVDDVRGRTAVELGIVDEPTRGLWLQRVVADRMLEIEGEFTFGAGEPRHVSVTSRVVEVDGEDRVVTVVRDLTSGRETERALIRRGAILETVSLAADRFLHGQEWQDGVAHVLESLGRAVDASRAYVLRRVTEPQDRAVLAYEWAAPGIAPLSSFASHQGGQGFAIDAGSRPQLQRREVTQRITSEVPQPDRARLEREGVLSFVTVPIFAGGGLWGTLGFDDCTTERHWADEENEALRIAAEILGASIQHAVEEANLEAAEAKYRALVEQIPAVVYIDAVEGPDTTIYISPQTEPMLGLSQLDWMRDPRLLSKHVHREDLQRWREALDRADATGEPLNLEYRIVTPDGRVVWVHDEAVLVQGGDQPRFWHGVMFDITERKAAEEALRDAFDRERVAAAHLRTLDEMKNTFLQAVSHELRTPLTAILGAALTLENRELVLAEDERRDLVVRLAANARKLHRLLGDLLDLDRLARGIVEPNRQETDLSELVRSVIAETEVLGDRPLHLDIRSVVLSVDAPKVERIVENLLANAARHTPGRTPVWIRVRPEEAGALLIVEDAGPGIPADVRESVFEPFRQLLPSDAPSPGVGVGLALVARFAELHGGLAWVEERDGGGASFRVFLPGNTGHAAEGLVPADASPAGG